MIKAIIFDLDGTLLNTSIDIKNSLNYVLKTNNFKPLTLKEVEGYLGYGSYNLVKDALPETVDNITFNKVYEEYVKYYLKHSNIETRPYDDIDKLIDLLIEDKYQVAIVSNKMHQAVVKLNEEVFDNKFNLVLGEHKGVKPKPNAEMLNIIVEKLSFSKEEIFYIGDTEVDLLTASNAKIKSVAVTWGFRSKENLIKHNPDYIIDKPLELIELLNKIK